MQAQSPDEAPAASGDKKRHGLSSSSRLLWFLAGLGFGAAATILLTPTSGEQLRNDIADATRRGIDRSREAAQQLGAKASEYYETSRRASADLGGKETKSDYE